MSGRARGKVSAGSSRATEPSSSSSMPGSSRFTATRHALRWASGYAPPMSCRRASAPRLSRKPDGSSTRSASTAAARSLRSAAARPPTWRGSPAATYLRGVAWAPVPSTLVGQVDAAIGGKTGVDLPGGKNLVGAFHWPARAVVDPELLGTLPPSELENGLAEVVKTGPARRRAAVGARARGAGAARGGVQGDRLPPRPARPR